jgi:hypothetical protein
MENWYFNTGNAGPHTVTDKSGWTLRSEVSTLVVHHTMIKMKATAKSDDGRIWVGGLALRVNPDGSG